MSHPFITTLSADEVFCFGANADGFHGAGAAGYAFRGTAKNTWRDDPVFQAAMMAPVGSPSRVGKWAVFGKARGPQLGRDGKSYAITTILRGGARRSVPLSDIEEQVVTLFKFALARPALKFLLTPLGANLAGYSATEMRDIFSRAIARLGNLPGNVNYTPSLYS